MLFDFNITYQDYSNVSLLLITLQPEKYQPEALHAAKKILESRVVTEMQYAEAEMIWQSEIQKKQQTLKKQDMLKEKVLDFFQPILKPTSAFTPEKWLRLFLLIIILQYIYRSIFMCIGLINIINCENCELGFELLYRLPSLLFIPFVIYLLWKRKKWGWILLFSNSFFITLSVIPDTIAFVAYARSSSDDYNFAFLVWRLFLYSGLSFLLWKENVALLFNVSFRTKKLTAGTVLLLFAAIYGGLALYSS
jgi:hypothetical protein